MSGRLAFRVDVLLPASVGLVMLGVVAALARQQTNRNGPSLIGTTIHDFGVIALGNTTSPLQHTFVLRNQSKNPVRIQRLSTTCGCTDASFDVDRVPPGGSVRVSATLHLSDSGTKEAQVLLDTDQEGQRVVRLTLRATGRRARHLTAIERHLKMQAGSSGSITVFALEYESDEMPSAPRLSGSAGLTLRFDGWTLVHPRHEASGHPARWEGRVHVRASSLGSASDTASVTISSAGSPPISIPVAIRN